MALMDLQSDLSWYGSSAPGFKPNADKSDTKFNNEGVSPSIQVSGYNNDGSILSPITRAAVDSFLIDDVTYSGRGLASRKAQLGAGSKFPIGPTGERHSFDKVRTGFTADFKYGDQYGVKFGDSGLADTYTANSPIDDMYNKFNLRDDATPNPGYAKQPFILRGIQREGETKNQRWGLGDTTAGKISSTIDLPRSGILTAGERSAIDAARIGKFLISPRGIGFLARQFGYQLMNPNTENIEGTAKGLPATQIYNPLSAPGQALVGGLLGSGKFTRHTNLTSLPLGGGGEYGATKNNQRLLNVATGPKKGRLIKLYGEYQEGTGLIFTGGPWKALTGPKGPGSILGIGTTSHTRTTATDLDSQRGYFGGLPGSQLANAAKKLFGNVGLKIGYENSFDDNFNRYNNEKPYQTTRGAGNQKLIEDIDNGLESPNLTPLSVQATDEFLPKPKDVKGDQPVTPGHSKLDQTDHIVMPYNNIPTRKGQKELLDFRVQRTLRNPSETDPARYLKEENRKSNFGNTLQLIDTIDASVDESLIDFSFGEIAFKAYLGSISDNFAPSWNSAEDQGRADPRYQYSGFERTISFDFIVVAYNKDQLEIIWNKLQDLARLTYPVYGSQGFFGQTVNVTIGKLFDERPMLIQDLGYDWDNETPWEIDEDYQSPLYTTVTMTCVVLGARPQSNSRLYDIKGLGDE